MSNLYEGLTSWDKRIRTICRSISICTLGSCVSVGEYPILEGISLRTMCPVSEQFGLYYMEVKVMRYGLMAIGISPPGFDINDIVGWSGSTRGYHGDDGMCYQASTAGTPYGPVFRKNDVVGMGINTVARECFFTLNGEFLGTAFFNIPRTVYPTVTLLTPYERIQTNFGDTTFRFASIYEMMDMVAHDVEYNEVKNDNHINHHIDVAFADPNHSKHEADKIIFHQENGPIEIEEMIYLSDLEDNDREIIA